MSHLCPGAANSGQETEITQELLAGELGFTDSPREQGIMKNSKEN